MKRRVPDHLLSFLAPGLLVLVACVQMALVRTHDLTAWKGGGFGMFSTFDAPTSRALRLVLLTEEGEAVVAFPNLRVRKERLLNMPSTGVLTDLAAQAVREDWIVYSYDQLAAIGSELPEEFQRQLARHEQARRAAHREDSTAAPPEGRPPLVAFSYARRSSKLEGRRPPILGARAEVWRLDFDAAIGQLHAEPIDSVTVEATR